MGDEESNYKVEYLDLPEDSTEEKEFVWVARAGKARVTYNSGSVYEGDFNDEKMKHGTGKFVWMTQGEEDEEPKPLATYEGEYADGKRSGVGTMTYPSGDTYTGEWKDNKMHGTGTYKYKKTDDIYSGSFVDGEKEGAGTYEFGKDSSRLDGTWAKGAFTSGEWQFKDAGNYQGTFEGGQPIGSGKFNFVTAGGIKIAQEGEYKSDAPVDPDAAEDAEPPVRTWHGKPVFSS
ncbi:translation initiation factor IF-2 [Aureococcus anophagefferens]|jgi:hypothetical protein|nr:translation initiation factor IF-2 [Aureococcus anophagefferens]